MLAAPIIKHPAIFTVFSSIRFRETQESKFQFRLILGLLLTGFQVLQTDNFGSWEFHQLS